MMRIDGEFIRNKCWLLHLSHNVAAVAQEFYDTIKPIYLRFTFNANKHYSFVAACVYVAARRCGERIDTDKIVELFDVSPCMFVDSAKRVVLALGLRDTDLGREILGW